MFVSDFDIRISDFVIFRCLSPDRQKPLETATEAVLVSVGLYNPLIEHRVHNFDKAHDIGSV